MRDATPRQSDSRRFEIRRCLGAGGFGEVYLATMSSTGGVQSEVALKVLHRDLDPQSQAVQRLRDEGRILGLLRHPAIVSIHDLVVLDGRAALVMEYVEGADLDACLQDPDPIGVRALIEVVGQVADALCTASQAKAPDGTALLLVHRDVKPGNIRVGRYGEVKLLDFGIAKATAGRREAKTLYDGVIGSTSYMAPERFRNDPLTSSADVYALGCTLYEALSRAELFERLDLHQQYRLCTDDRLHDSFIDGRLAMLHTEPEVIALLRAMLAAAPGARPDLASVSHQCDAIADGMSGLPLRRWARAHPWPEPSDAKGELLGRTVTEQVTFPSPTAFAATLLRDPSERELFVPSHSVPPPPERPPPGTSRSIWIGIGIGLVSILVSAASILIATVATGLWWMG